MIEILKNPWHWSIAGIFIGLTVPTLLILGNKAFGISANLKHICAMCLPANIGYFKYDWKKEFWNLFFVLGVMGGAFIGQFYLNNGLDLAISINTKADLQDLGISDFSGLMPKELFGISAILSIKGLIFLVIGGFLIGFGTRYGEGCTSGHAIMGLSNLQIPSLIATISFMVGGFVMTHLIFPFIFSFFK